MWEKDKDEPLAVDFKQASTSPAINDLNYYELRKLELTKLPFERVLPEDILMAEKYLQRKDKLADSISLGRNILSSLFVRMEAGMPLDIEDHQVARLIREIIQAGQNK